ncbi:MAG TPA: PD-(D/E)XK nuclease family protein [Rugosibacter sp.]
MTLTDLPAILLADLPGGPDVVVLCPTARLAADMRRAHGAAQVRAGATAWHALLSATPAQWLDHLTSAALLRGEISPSALPGRFLTRPQERSVWELAVANDLSALSGADDVAGLADLFDRDGMALAAAEAESVRLAWRITVPEALQTEEYRAFLRWRKQVEKICEPGNWHTADAALMWRIACIERGLAGLPAQVGVAGFTVPDPLHARLLAVLAARGVTLFQVDFSTAGATLVRMGECVDAEAECQAAAHWAHAMLAQNAQARVRIAVADLPGQRHLLTRALEEALHAESVGAVDMAWAARERDYAFATGTPLAAESLVDAGLQLLQLAVRPQRMALAGAGALLCGPGWSADVTEADARAQVEVALRKLLPPEMSLERWQRALVRYLVRGSADHSAPQLVTHTTVLLDASRDFAQLRRQLPSAWGERFDAVLIALGWPGQRPMWPAERAACEALREVLAALAQLDAMLGTVTAGEALRQVQRQCRDVQFHAPREHPPRVEVCTLADAVAGPVDGLWLLGMNEGVWPLAPHPNPLLPAELQRRAGVPAARADSLTVQAQTMQTLWLKSAPTVVFSWAGREGEKQLQPSPLLNDMMPYRQDFQQDLEYTVAPLPEQVPMEQFEDARAPDVTANEAIHGGTALLQAQALCPAWGFYRYRLGATVLPAPTFGLDAKTRGALLHLALEHFWRGRSQVDLLQMPVPVCEAFIQQAVNHALEQFQQRAIEPLPMRLAQLEVARLQRVLARWLAIEAQRAPFRVVACEARHDLNIEGLPVRVVVDRIDELPDGRLVIIDYKSGRSARADSWAQSRMAEPQLPVYAALAFPDRAVAAVVLARVVMDEAGFSGVAEEAGLLPDVLPLDAQRRRYAEADFPNWPAVRERWAERLTELALEIRHGCAAVVFENEKDLAYCDVSPLLRVAERKAQWESTVQEKTARAP